MSQKKNGSNNKVDDPNDDEAPDLERGLPDADEIQDYNQVNQNANAVPSAQEAAQPGGNCISTKYVTSFYIQWSCTSKIFDCPFNLLGISSWREQVPSLAEGL